jgi:translation elongation factor EF-Tu-like GTPase
MILKVTVTFLNASQGGRVTAPASGYRPPLWFGDTDAAGEPLLWDFEFRFTSEDPDALVPFNTEVPAVIRAGSATEKDLSVREGSRFEVREGARVVGRGLVTEVMPT